MIRIYLTFLGCKLNQAEIETLGRAITSAGHGVVSDPGQADWAIVNTCAVTHIAARKSRQLVRRLRARNPMLRVAVIGCYADTSPVEAADLGVDLVMPNREKERVVERILGHVPAEDSLSKGGGRVPGARIRALVKIQDGCDNHCTYCIVREARGASRSRAPERVLAEVRRRLDEGHREVILTGVNIGAYGRDRRDDAPLPPTAGWSLARLVREILESTVVPRLRLSSVEPWDVTDELLALWPDSRLCRHLHLPLQSGCDETLRRMGRGYTVSRFEETVRALRERVPDMAITTDLIVGFPGETDDEFEKTTRTVAQLAFSRLHVFRYSPRPGTPAASLPGAVDPRVAKSAAGVDGHRSPVGGGVLSPTGG